MLLLLLSLRTFWVTSSESRPRYRLRRGLASMLILGKSSFSRLRSLQSSISWRVSRHIWVWSNILSYWLELRIARPSFASNERRVTPPWA